jgi:UDP-N-acetylglucosamine 4,6-dehydratase/5-epimerase
MSFFKDRKVLIVGGTGTIGKSLLKNILDQNPAVVRIFSRDEHKQFEMQNKLSNNLNIRYLIGDVRDENRLLRAMKDIDYVFHVAAMKHVSSCEYNPIEAVRTNILGTQNVIQCSLSAGVKRTVFTSTDKAISPTNTYGASKLMAERLVASAQFNNGAHDTVFTSVRFGNVIGSRGSVIPLFISQILKERKIKITDPTMTRFMMTLEQATLLTLQAMQQAQGGEIFVLKMPSIRLEDLAYAVLSEMGHLLNISPSQFSVETIGLRPGEKMFEELMTEDEAVNALELSDMFVVPNSFIEKKHQYDNATAAISNGYSSHDAQPISKDEVVQIVRQYMSNYFQAELS